MRLKENTIENAKKALRFDDAINVVSAGFRCELCNETFLQRHDCMIHQYSSCLPKKGVRRTTLGVIEPIPGFQQRTNTLPVVQPAQDTCTSNGDPLNHDEIQLVWESKAVKTVDHTKKLEDCPKEAY